MDSVTDVGVILRPVSGFGHLRINAWLAAPRSLAQPSHVLHRLSTPKHPPDTLNNLTTLVENLCSRDICDSNIVVTTLPEMSMSTFRPSRAERSHPQDQVEPPEAGDPEADALAAFDSWVIGLLFS